MTTLTPLENGAEEFGYAARTMLTARVQFADGAYRDMQASAIALLLRRTLLTRKSVPISASAMSSCETAPMHARGPPGVHDAEVIPTRTNAAAFVTVTPNGPMNNMQHVQRLFPLACLSRRTIACRLACPTTAVSSTRAPASC